MKKLIVCIFVLLLVNTAYVAALPSATIFFVANVLLHVVLGLAASAGLVWVLRSRASYSGWVLGFAALTGVWLIFAGATRSNHWIVALHVVAGV
ncbi:MAG: hypothetical protein JO022_20065, partial [Acidobacteriaceae bacterium]|nr:hypothetical protein [Acidobacteriaceae bacterium]